MTSKKLLLTTAISSIALALSATQSYAGPFTPELHGEIVFEVQDDWTFDSDDTTAEVNTITTTIEPYLALSITDKIMVEAGLVVEQVQDPDAGDDTIFENEGAYVEQLMLSYNDDNYSVFAGKFGPTFGTAWDLAPGIYGVDFAEDYEIAEQIGLGGSLSFGSEQTGDHTITGNAFFADTTFLAESTITERGDLDKEDGGLGNTEDLSSFSVTLDSENVVGVEGLNTHIGYRDQAEGDADAGLTNQTGYVAGANYTFPVADNIEATALVEWVGIQNSEGGADDVSYITTSLGVTIDGNWNVAASYTGRDMDISGGADVDDHLYQLSAGYEFDNGFTVDLGFSNREEAGVESNIAGALLGYSFEF